MNDTQQYQKKKERRNHIYLYIKIDHEPSIKHKKMKTTLIKFCHSTHTKNQSEKNIYKIIKHLSKKIFFFSN